MFDVREELEHILKFWICLNCFIRSFKFVCFIQKISSFLVMPSKEKEFSFQNVTILIISKKKECCVCDKTISSNVPHQFELFQPARILLFCSRSTHSDHFYGVCLISRGGELVVSSGRAIHHDRHRVGQQWDRAKVGAAGRRGQQWDGARGPAIPEPVAKPELGWEWARSHLSGIAG